MVRRSRTKKTIDKISNNANKIAGFVSAIIVLVSAVTGACTWISNQFASAVSSQIADFRQETKNSNDKQEQAITRVELMVLMEHDADNVIAIEKMARYYFQELDGDLYMTQKYSEWAKANGGDMNIIIGGTK